MIRLFEFDFEGLDDTQDSTPQQNFTPGYEKQGIGVDLKSHMGYNPFNKSAKPMGELNLSPDQINVILWGRKVFLYA